MNEILKRHPVLVQKYRLFCRLCADFQKWIPVGAAVAGIIYLKSNLGRK
jgi:hypothetical protein